MTDGYSLPLPSKRSQLTALLTGPVVWIVYFLIVWAIGEFGCLSGALQFALGGLPAITALVLLITVIALIVVFSVGWRAFVEWRRVRGRADARGREREPETGSDEQARTQFLGLGSVLLSVLFGFAILLSGVPLLVLRPCG